MQVVGWLLVAVYLLAGCESRLTVKTRSMAEVKVGGYTGLDHNRVELAAAAPDTPDKPYFTLSTSKGNPWRMRPETYALTMRAYRDAELVLSSEFCAEEDRTLNTITIAPGLNEIELIACDAQGKPYHPQVADDQKNHDGKHEAGIQPTPNATPVNTHADIDITPVYRPGGASGTGG